MLVNLNDVLLKARNEKYAVGLFNTINLEMAKGVIEAAEELKSPVIVGTAEVLLPVASLEEVRDILVPMAERASVPVVLHYDHGLTREKVIEALRAGFSSVMYDCSLDTYDDNMAKVKEITAIAHAFGATVEAELGHVGANENAAESSGSDHSIYTEPDQAREYAIKTGVDALAVAIGTAHGAYKEKPKLEINRLKEIRDIVDIPLVLHGGSGLSDDDFRNCVANGISKINIFTDVNNAALEAVIQNYEKGKGASDVSGFIIDMVKEETKKKMILFGSAGKA